jgi:hypothetical protein
VPHLLIDFLPSTQDLFHFLTADRPAAIRVEERKGGLQFILRQ